MSLVRAVGVEPTLLSEPDFESGASANSATPAWRVPAPGGACASAGLYDFRAAAVQSVANGAGAARRATDRRRPLAMGGKTRESLA